ncbi:MAG: HD domain-containing protein, partial [Bacteroidales bacterium]|nr:HD domain-containing protein [Bacteroidales bacterium]
TRQNQHDQAELRMMKTFAETIGEVEARWLSPMFAQCRDLFSGVFLPSHDHLHHARVWSHARALLNLLSESTSIIPESLVEELIIAVFFHDVGLIRTTEEKHGLESRFLCEEFFKSNKTDIQKPDAESFLNILDAIERHDDKSLKSTIPDFRPGIVPDLLSLLSTSDDLDAFGAIGIYRYAEIYLFRGIGQEQLPLRVSGNIDIRFKNLKNTFKSYTDFVRLQETRFRVVYNFYLSLAQAYARNDEKPSWEPFLIKIFHDSLLNRQNILMTNRILPECGFETEINAWFNALDREVPGYFT